MTQLTPPAPPLSARPFTLATDLDGTFLGGSDADRQRLYRWIERHRDSIGLVFVTGRDPAFITEMIRAGQLARPDYVIGDVGTTIAAVDNTAQLHPIAALEADIAERWNDMGDRVRAALDEHPGLSLQPIHFRHRISYDMDPTQFDEKSTATVRALGLDPLISDNRFFDVLPPGVSKGPSLLRLIAELDIAAPRVLAAGDTLNDLSMLTCGVPAVAVGGSEAALIEALADAPDVYRAQAVGAAGILEAIAALDLHPNSEESTHVL
ncbi:MAG: HAD-IIB family hydrolase [Qingshengfaniella sp.]